MSILEQVLFGVMVGVWAPFFIGLILFMMYAGKRNGDKHD
jgi:hypothetical protein